MVEFVAFWILMAGACAVVAGSKGRSVVGWLLLGALFSAVALIVVAVMPSLKPAVDAPSVETHKKCPFCAEQVRREAIVCKHCGRDLAQHDEAIREAASAEGNALVAAAKDGNWATVFSLLNGGASPNARNDQGRTALDVAEEMKDQQIVALLVSHGARRTAS